MRSHIAVDQERQLTEHPLLRQTRFALHDLPDAVGEVLVVSHDGSVPPLGGKKEPQSGVRPPGRSGSPLPNGSKPSIDQQPARDRRQT
jgi:hypothetical protein